MRIGLFIGGPLDGSIRAIPDPEPIVFPRHMEPEGPRLGEYRKDPLNPRRWLWHPEES